MTKPSADKFISFKPLWLLSVFFVFLGIQLSSLGMNCSSSRGLDSLAPAIPTCYDQASLGLPHERDCVGCVFHAIATPFSHLSLVENNKLGSSIDEFSRLVSKAFLLVNVYLGDSLKDASLSLGSTSDSPGIHLTNHTKIIRTVVILV